MSILRRMFSADYRRAVAAEAAGDYAEAARAYALAGERAKVAEMHLLRSERAPSPQDKLHELRAAIRFADRDEDAGRRVLHRIARALLGWARAAAYLGEEEQKVVRDAAGLFVEVGDFSSAGECHELNGDELAAAEAYQKGGDLERLESVLGKEEQRRRRDQRVYDSFAEYKLALASGERDRAFDAIRVCADAPLPVGVKDLSEPMRERASFARLAEELKARLITDGSVLIRAGAAGQGRASRYVGAFPLLLGRESLCQLPLRDAGISRQHAAIEYVGHADDGRFMLRDLGSKNGTTLAGVRVAGTLPLSGTGEIGLGELCVVAFAVAGARLTLEVTRGLDRGARVEAGLGALDVEGAAELMFIDRRPRLSAIGGRLLYLNGAHAGGAIQLIHGDVVELAEVRLEVG